MYDIAKSDEEKKMSEINVLKASAKDASKIGKIAYQVAQIHYQQTDKEFKKPTLKSQTEYISSSIADKDILVLKAQIGDKIVGYVVVYFNTYPAKHFQFNKRAFIGSIGVDKNHQQKGIGKALLKGVEEEVKKRKISVIEIDYYVFNKAAGKLYKNSGYEEKKSYMHKFIH